MLLASATYSGALDALIDRRPGPHGARKGLQLLQAEVTAKEAYDRARRAAEKARAEEDRLWAAWCVETGL
ncbi:MAG: hypothetical protein B7Z41_04110 [Rhizobiales bacterium 12-66-7]|nr:MAG: hypothetical protein B7Z41_04110 [Rhizobiales bacterium 12-66-7]